MYHMQTASSGGGGDHRVKPCQQPGTLAVAAATAAPVAPMSVAPVLIKTLIVVPPNKAATTDALRKEGRRQMADRQPAGRAEVTGGG